MKIKMQDVTKRVGIGWRKKLYGVKVRVEFDKDERKAIKQRKLTKKVIMQREPCAYAGVGIQLPFPFGIFNYPVRMVTAPFMKSLHDLMLFELYTSNEYYLKTKHEADQYKKELQAVLDNLPNLLAGIEEAKGKDEAFEL